MKLLFVGDEYLGDKEHMHTLARLPALVGHQVSTTFSKRPNATEIAMICKSNNIDGVICSQQTLFEAALRSQVDFIPPPNRKALSLNDYAGSWLDLPYNIPLLVVNPLNRLVTVPEERFMLNRYVSKLTKPERWYPQTDFKWKQVFEHTADEAFAIIEASDLCAIDIETIGDEMRSIELVGYAAYSHTTKQLHIFVVHMNSEWAWRFVQKANASSPQKIFQNGQYDNTYFARWNCMPNNWLWDTLTLMHCWYSELPKKLDFIASFALRKMRYWKDDGKSGSMEDKMRYNALDVWATLNSFLAIIAEMPEYAMRNYLIEFPMNFPSLNAALEGIRVDEAQFHKVREAKKQEAESLLEKVRYWLSSPDFNPRSPVQMKQLFRLLGCGALPDTAKASQLKARAASPLNDLVLGQIAKYKEAAKLVSSYLDPDKLWNGRWYYAIDPAGTDTGRSASRASAFWCGDSIQTIPRGDAIKSFMIADPGYYLAEADKAQSEARCVGYQAGETSLIELVEGPHDYHAWNAQAFFGVPYETIYDEATGKTINKDLRDLSKRTNHGANYNMGANVMLDTMGPKMVAKAKSILGLAPKMPLKQVCAHLLETYAKTYPNVKGLFQEVIIRQIELTNTLVSPLGWTRWFFAKPSKTNKPALNAAVAHGPQNLSVSILNIEWYKIWRMTVYGEFRGLVRIKAQIHDSIFFQYRKDFDPEQVLKLMHTPVTVTGADGKKRTMLIPSDMKKGASAWSNLK
jgi:DNA polymerase I-like protein with 3'-5' exonuclease and polymerase domains